MCKIHFDQGSNRLGTLLSALYLATSDVSEGNGHYSLAIVEKG